MISLSARKNQDHAWLNLLFLNFNYLFICLFIYLCCCRFNIFVWNLCCCFLFCFFVCLFFSSWARLGPVSPATKRSCWWMNAARMMKLSRDWLGSDTPTWVISTELARLEWSLSCQFLFSGRRMPHILYTQMLAFSEACFWSQWAPFEFVFLMSCDQLVQGFLNFLHKLYKWEEG